MLIIRSQISAYHTEDGYRVCTKCKIRGCEIADTGLYSCIGIQVRRRFIETHFILLFIMIRKKLKMLRLRKKFVSLTK